MTKYDLQKMYREIEDAAKIIESVKNRYFPVIVETEATTQIEENLRDAHMSLFDALCNISALYGKNNTPPQV